MNTKENFCGWKISSFFDKWTKLTSDKYVLDIVRGYCIEFVDLPSQNKLPKQLKFSELEHKQIYDQITKFLDKAIIEKAKKCFCTTKQNLHVRIYLDNAVAVQYMYINHMGGRKTYLNNLDSRNMAVVHEMKCMAKCMSFTWEVECRSR
jgi:hypothetical protein